MFKRHQLLGRSLMVLIGNGLCLSLWAQTSPPPTIHLTLTNGQQIISWDPLPAIESYSILTGTNLSQALGNDTNGTVSGYQWSAPATAEQAFHQLQVTPLSEEALLTANVLNRLAYGPTPDDLERVLTGTNAIGPQAYIDEQLAPELIAETMDTDPPQTNWTYVTATGAASASGRLIIYFNGAGDLHLDDIVLVEGAVPETGTNLIANGGFELSPLTNFYIMHSNYAQSAISTEVAHSGSSSLHLVGLSRGNTSRNAFYQQLQVDQSGNTQYTLSFWYLPNPELDNPSRTLTVRLSGGLNPGGTRATVSAVSGGPPVIPANLYRALENGTARLADLRAWYMLHCVGGKQQLLEVLTQFFENHFVTQHDKSYDWVNRYFDGSAIRDQMATRFEWREISRWRRALLDPQCTFYDLLKISAESPAMIIYLDTVSSRGDGRRIANENYARELLELFCNGVDNGYDQDDIVEMSKAWTGWTVDVLDLENIDNPLGPRSTTLIDTNFSNARSNLFGVWTFRYRQDWHHNAAKTIFPGKTVEARFGPPWAGRSYELALPERSGPDGLQDGYDVITHLANLPYTEEFISVKLCRLFVHDDFVHGVYDYRDEAHLSPEGKLVKQCMLAWENNTPKGQIRRVLQTIFNSELFRGHGGSLQKVKTPLEFAVSAIRAIRARKANGRFTAETDGYALTGTGRTTGSAPLPRMGSMFLFDRSDPDGYPESAPPWISAGTLVERLRFVQTFLNTSSTGNFSDPVGLLKLKLPAASWNNADAVADFFLNIIYPGEGRANLDLYHNSAVTFLNTDDDGVAASPFSSLGNSAAAYDTRLRGMVSMLMTFQRFQEQ